MVKQISEGYLLTEEEYESIKKVKVDGKEMYLVGSVKVPEKSIEELIAEGRTRGEIIQMKNTTSHHFNKWLKSNFNSTKFTDVKKIIRSRNVSANNSNSKE